MVEFMGVRKKCPKKWTPGSQKIYMTNNICSIVPTLVNYSDNNKTIIFSKFQALITSNTRKVILASGQELCFEIINEINKW